MKKANRLTFFCQNNDNRNVVNLLKQNPDLDLTMREGVCFFYAIKYNNVEMLNNFLDYYKNIRLQGDHDSMEYKIANYKLKQILQEKVNVLDHVSPEILEILAPYITTVEDSDEEEDLPDFDHYDIDELNGDISVDVHSNEQDLLGVDDHAADELAEDISADVHISGEVVDDIT